jgi:hypothetical protein
MYFFSFLPAVLLALSLCAAWRSMQANHREFCASTSSVFTIFEEAA